MKLKAEKKAAKQAKQAAKKKQKKANHRWFKKSKARNTEADDMMPGQNAYEVSDACKGEEQGKLQEANQRDEQWQM